MSEELRECPFCGGTHSINVINFFTGDSFRKCDICGAEAPEAKTPEEAAKKWNTRPAEDALKAEITRYRRALHNLKEDCRQRCSWSSSEQMFLDEMITHIEAELDFTPDTEKGGEDE